MTDVEILRDSYCLKVYFIYQSALWPYRVSVEIRELPDDFDIDHVDSETGEYTPSDHARKELNGEDVEAGYGRSGSCYRVQSAFMVKKENWTQMLTDCIAAHKKIKESNS
jgi:hypothetical protein